MCFFEVFCLFCVCVGVGGGWVWGAVVFWGCYFRSQTSPSPAKVEAVPFETPVNLSLLTKSHKMTINKAHHRSEFS